MLRATSAVCAREFAAYFATPLAVVFLVIFLIAQGVFTFSLGQFYESETASLDVFFSFHPWLYLFLIPAISMRLWSEERRGGTLELLLTLPIPLAASVIGKFLAAWAFAGLALALTFPIWLTVNYLGDPDNGTIAAGYVGSFLMAGGYLAIGSAVSAATSNQVIAFVVAVVISFFFTIAGSPIVIDVVAALGAPIALTSTISSMSFLTHFAAIMGGVVDLRDVVFFASTIAFFLFVTATLIDLRRAG